MARAVYLTSLESESGKSLVALGLMEILSRRVDRVGYFRPVVDADGRPDDTVELFRDRYRLAQTYDESFGVTADRTRGLGSGNAGSEIVDEVLGRFETLARTCDMVVVEGTDYSGASAAFEVDLNARLAANLGATVIVVASARERDPGQVRGALAAAQSTFGAHRVPVVAHVVNRVRQDLLEDFQRACDGSAVPTWVLPEIPGLDRPTLGDVAQALGAAVLVGDAERLTREVAATRVAAMTLPNVLDYLQPDSLVVVPGDRADVIVACLTARFTKAFPAPAGLLLTGGLPPDPQVLRFAEGLDDPVTPLLMVPGDTYATASALADVHPSITVGAERKIALALGAFERLVDTEAVARRLEVVGSTIVTPLMFEHRLLDWARADRRHIVLPEGDDDRVLQAAERLLRRDIVELTILGDPSAVADRARVLGLDLSGADVLDPRSPDLRGRLAEELHRLRAGKGLALDAAYDLLSDVSYFGTMMVHLGLVDGMVSGATHTTAHTVRPALQVIRTQPGTSIVSSVFFMALPDRVLVYGDCAINPDPDAAALADIAVSSARTAAAFGIRPRVAMLSYSTGGSGSGADVDKVREATALVRRRAPDLLVEGPIQYDAAVDPGVAATKLPDSEVAGRATVLIFPDLNTGNNTYKAVQRSAGAVAIGPVLQGLRKPVNDLSRGALVEDIVSTVVITAIQAQHVDGPGGVQA